MSMLIPCIAITLGFAFYGSLVCFVIWLSRKLYKKQNKPYSYDYMYKKSGH